VAIVGKGRSGVLGVALFVDVVGGGILCICCFFFFLHH